MNPNYISSIKINDDSILYDGHEFKYSLKNGNIILDNGFLLKFTTEDVICEFLSNRNIIVKKCKEDELFIANNIKNSNITIDVLNVRYQSDRLEYSVDEDILKEKKDEFNYESGNGTKITIKGYYIDNGYGYTIIPDELYQRVSDILRNKSYSKIKIDHSNKLIGVEPCLEKCFDY